MAVARSVAALFLDTDLLVRLVADVERLRWERLVRICGVVGLAALMQTNMDRLSNIDANHNHLWVIIMECAEIAEASGHPVDIGELAGLLERLPSIVPALIGAMLNRVERRDCREIANLAEQIVRSARRANIATPLLDLVATGLAARVTDAADDDSPEIIRPRPVPKPRRDGWFSQQWHARPTGGRR